jgi:D-sedoheptulose 7-phosphate isomerase
VSHDQLALDKLGSLSDALAAFQAETPRLRRWGHALAGVLGRGGRLLVAGNGGSAAEAQHLAAELVGKMNFERRPLSAIALTAETSSLTAIANDYGFDAVFARQVRAHGRPGDLLLTLSTSGRSPNLLAAVEAATAAGLRTWALTGPRPNPLAAAVDDTVAVPSPDPQTVQELHLVCVHLLCAHVDAVVGAPLLEGSPL